MANDLSAVYRDMSDGELLALGARPQDLTDAAKGVLERELAARGLIAEPVVDVPEVLPEFAAEPEEELAPGKVSLYVFNDAIEGQAALSHLEEAGLAFELRDQSVAQGGLGFYSQGYSVALQVVVAKDDWPAGVALLRAKMGLFPLAEVAAGPAEPDSGDEMETLGVFEQRDEANEFMRLMEQAGIWCRLVYLAGDNPFEIQVWASDLDRAIALVEGSLDVGGAD